MIWGAIGMLLKCSEKINVENKDVLKSWNGFRNYFMKDTIDIRHVERKDVVNMIKERMKDFYTQMKLKPNMAMIKREGLGQIFTGK